MVFKDTAVGRVFTHTAAQQIVGRCMRYDSEITFEMGTKKINGKSLMGVISMALKSDDVVTVIAKGDDQEDALAAAVKMLSAKHPE